MKGASMRLLAPRRLALVRAFNRLVKLALTWTIVLHYSRPFFLS